MSKLIIFDLDGVLVDSKDIHFNALNHALESIDKKYCISYEDHKNIYDGLPTSKKLEILTSKTGLSTDLYSKIWKNKQEKTEQLFLDIANDQELIEIFKYIKKNEIKIAVASNSISKTVLQCLKSLGILSYVDIVVSNEDVKNPKPSPEMYWKAMAEVRSTPSETIILEDSHIGLIAANDSGANVVEIKNRGHLTCDKIKDIVEKLLKTQNSWKGGAMNVLIPMAGAGSRFSDAGYSFPKPLIDVDGMPMIHSVVNNLSIDATYTYIVQKDHYEKYNLSYLLNAITPKCNIVQVDGITEGAAVTCLLAKDFIDNEEPLVLANSDQILEWSSREFLYEMYSKNADGGIATFKSSHPKWSYAKVDDSGLVVEVAEKKPISDNATVGVYYWKHGSDFVKYAEQMINKNIRVNGEFYTCPVFNEAISDGKNIYSVPIQKMWGIGTPEDLQDYLRRKSD